MLLLGIYLAVSRRDIREIGAPVLASLAVMPLIILVFFSYWIFVRHELMALDMIIYISAMVLAIQLAKRWRVKPFVRNNWGLWIVVAILTILATGFLTYNAPDWIIFEDMG